ncbi:MAG TPA: MBL fold metallo-hydrolase [Vicinamibacterales bacterium]|jgi:glyoxylase-like metal-dependent hydrolase (beta-lactamase superfamily II)
MTPTVLRRFPGIPGILLVVAASGACASRTPEQQVVDAAASALGGKTRILAVKTIVVEGDGTIANLGQDMTMDSSSQQFVVSGYRRAVDVANFRARTEQTRTPNFVYFQGPAPQKQIFGVDGSVGYNVAADGKATRTSGVVARDRAVDSYHHPVMLVRTALAPDAKLANVHTSGTERTVDVTTTGGMTFTLAIDAATGLPTRVVSMEDNPNLGDVAIETTFADYESVGGLKLPRQLTTKTDRYATSTLHVTKQTVDGDAGDLSAPQAAASSPPAPVAPAPVVTVEQIAPRIWLLAGQSHHSVVAEFADHLMLIEAPQNDARTLAVIAKARSLQPAKPLTQVVNTHHHFDHSGGLRAAVSEGLTVITQKGNEAFVRDDVQRAHAINPDALARHPQSLKVVTVDEDMELKDAAMTVDLIHVTGNPHSDTLLMAYFPRERVLVEVDAYSPGAAVQPFAANLRDNISAHHMRVDRIVPLHGPVATYADLLQAK